ncbi:hypothetical protein [Paenibacillus lutimineralis]|uniref:Uncharacterized protein n=1 Tax=Paenibacillus lutimineralis TaxID=2707005 RepID=A0A3Q9I7A2_9BACL|nr:hypothetical protein [Paenibacillus lutimineralis]AZS14233.1 hypothetical protein EI981_07000 [Paenibacillus lutimineralis]
MAKTDWNLRDTIRPEDMNELGQEINEHGGKIAEQGLEIEEHDKTILEQGTKITEQGKSISALENRLDTEEYAEITLQQGLQVVKAERDSRFRLGSIKGRTLINLLGSAGGCEDASIFSISSGSATPSYFVSTPLEADSGSSGIRATWNDINMGSSYAKYVPIPNSLVPGKTYLAALVVKTNNPSIGGRIAIRKTDTAISGETTIQSSNYSLSYLKFMADGKETAVGCFFAVNNQSGFVSFDSIRLYELSQAESVAFDGLAPEQIAEKYSYVSSGIIGVENPYVIRYGENLLPPFYEWTTYTQDGVNTYKSSGVYEVSFIAEQGKQGFVYYDLPLVPNRYYTLSSQHTGYISVTSLDLNSVLLPNTVEQSGTFFSGKATLGRVYLSNIGDGSLTGKGGLFTFKSPMLSLGTEAKPFKPREDAMLAFQTELHANPDTGAEPDELFEQNGQYFKLAKWKKVVLDESRFWGIDAGNVTPEYKPLYFRDGTIQAKDYITYATKYDGTRLFNRETASYTGADQTLMYRNGIHLTVANSDSGWGPNYSPTQDEIKAYLMGWKMYLYGNVTQPYNGTGTRAWGKLGLPLNPDGGLKDGTTTLPTQSYPEWNYYQLLYRFAEETVEPVVSEDCLTLSEGDNVVEVGTGIVLREKTNPKQVGGIAYRINSISMSNQFKYRLGTPIEVSRNNNIDYHWVYVDNSVVSNDGYGKGVLQINSPADYDPSAAYNVTYIKLDKSPVAPITGSLAANEKAQISDLTAGVAEALHGVSVNGAQLPAHVDAKVHSTEVHGLRIQADKLQYQKANGDWDKVGGEEVLLSNSITGIRTDVAATELAVNRAANVPYTDKTLIIASLKNSPTLTQQASTVIPFDNVLTDTLGELNGDGSFTLRDSGTYYVSIDIGAFNTSDIPQYTDFFISISYPSDQYLANYRVPKSTSIVRLIGGGLLVVKNNYESYKISIWTDAANVRLGLNSYLNVARLR